MASENTLIQWRAKQIGKQKVKQKVKQNFGGVGRSFGLRFSASTLNPRQSRNLRNLRSQIWGQSNNTQVISPGLSDLTLTPNYVPGQAICTDQLGELTMEFLLFLAKYFVAADGQEWQQEDEDEDPGECAVAVPGAVR